MIEFFGVPVSWWGGFLFPPCEGDYNAPTTIYWPWFGKGLDYTSDWLELDDWMSNLFASTNLWHLIIRFGSSNRHKRFDFSLLLVGLGLLLSLA